VFVNFSQDASSMWTSLFLVITQDGPVCASFALVWWLSNWLAAWCGSIATAVVSALFAAVSYVAIALTIADALFYRRMAEALQLSTLAIVFGAQRRATFTTIRNLFPLFDAVVGVVRRARVSLLER
jgi:hypothetical protein